MGANWDIFDTLARHRAGRSWRELDALESALALASSELRLEVAARMHELSAAMEDLGVGDPSSTDLANFRPLRLRREEAWSDWLAHFLESSVTGSFAGALLGRDAARCRRPTVVREESNDASRRADLVVLWADGSGSTIEVKAGDRCFDKTLETAEAAHRRHPEVPSEMWQDALLVLPDDLTLPTLGRLSEALQVITWITVARALRTALRERGESALWRLWAWSFAGSIEQRLLGLSSAPTPATLRVRDLPRWRAVTGCATEHAHD